jgi:EmrB/QacA subfamily drug resistance transporter
MTFTPFRRASARRQTAHASAEAGASSNPAIVLGLILSAYLMIVLDLTVIITALPEIRTGLGFSDANLSWVQNAYALTFGGLLLLGARAGDILGRRRVFLAGISLFTLASLVAGLAQSETWLLAARAVQGVGAAVAAPSTLALLTITFREGTERTRALGYYSAVAGGGGSIGLVLGGLLTDLISWRWGLFVNVPVGLAVLALAPRHLPETEPRMGHFDVVGAVTSTLGMTAVVYGFVRAAEEGWGQGWTIASFAAGVALLIAFILNERRAEQPITPLRLFARRERAGAYAARVLVVGGMFSMFFFLTQYLQGVLDYSPLRAGLSFLPMSAVMFLTVQVVPRLAPRVSGSTRLVGGLTSSLAGMVWLSRLSAETAFFPGIAVPFMLLGIGIGLALVPLTEAGIAGVAESDAGAASGIMNAAQQVGASLGIAILVTIFTSAGEPSAGAAGLADAVSAAVTGSAVFLALGLAVVLLVMRAARPAVAIERVRSWAAAAR